MYKLRTSAAFDKKFGKIIPKNKQKDVWSRIHKLVLNAYMGKPLRYDFVRELKLEKFRIYFIIFEEEILVFLVDVSDKKAQKETIDMIIHKYIKNLNKGDII